MEEQIVSLYVAGKGIKAIAKELDLAPSNVRRKLISLGVYQGVNHNVGQEGEDTNEVEELASLSEQETMENPVPPLEGWTCRGDVTVRKDDNGWSVSLGSGFLNELVSPSLPGWQGKGVEFSASLRSCSPPFASVIIGVRDKNSPVGNETRVLLTPGFIPSAWYSHHLCGQDEDEIECFLKSNNYQPTTFFISGLHIKEIPTGGLKPVPVVEEKRLQAGEKILLAPLWRTDGSSTITPAPWSTAAMLVEFAGSGSIYAALPREAAGHKARLVVELRSLGGAAEIEIALGDDGDSERLTTKARRDPANYYLERVLGKNGHVRISCKEYGREEVLLNDAYVEVMN